MHNRANHPSKKSVFTPGKLRIIITIISILVAMHFPIFGLLIAQALCTGTIPRKPKALLTAKS